MAASDEQKSTEETKAPKKKRRTKSKARLVSKVIARIEEKLDAEDVKGSIGDLVRLISLEKELEADEKQKQPKEIKVSWVEKDEKEHASGE